METMLWIIGILIFIFLEFLLYMYGLKKGLYVGYTKALDMVIKYLDDLDYDGPDLSSNRYSDYLKSFEDMDNAKED